MSSGGLGGERPQEVLHPLNTTSDLVSVSYHMLY